ncbi:CAP domain-containing protein [Cellulomonas sp. 179-A 9B4 NHS]|uniref:CAP domain-containing protein n=1 Tax=Cellulomonas sp. 179-A 9B4 NHS TaxID=3142379 RepID=UPI0039A2D30F
MPDDARDVPADVPHAPAPAPGRRAPVPGAAVALLAVAAVLGVGAVVATLGPGGGAGAPGTGPDAPTATSPAVVDLSRVAPDDYARDLLAATTAEREAAGLPAWGEATCAADAAAARAADLVGQDLEHAPLDDVLAACAPRSVAAENLSRAAVDPADVATAWMGSPGHRANVVDPGLEDAVTACVRDGEQMLCTLVLVGP